MSYRVETAVSKRAGCQQTECKKQGIKIDKGELRFGVWVEINGNGSWRWKHWGCMTGKQLQNVRAYLDVEGTGNYQWDRLDGYDDEGKGGLVAHPGLQEKVRRVVTQGYIDAEDWKGDPEMNKLGETGIFTSETKKKMRDAAKAEANQIEEEAESVKQGPTDATKKPTTKKRAKAESDDEDAFQEGKPPPKKKRVTKAKVKKEDNEDDDEAEVKTETAVQKGRKKAVKKEPLDEENVIDNAPEIEPKPVSKRGRKKTVKEEPVDDTPEIEPKPVSEKGRKKTVKVEPVDDTLEIEPKPVRNKSRKKAAKEEPVDEKTAPDRVDEAKPKIAPKKGRKKAVEADELSADNAAVAKPMAAAAKGRKKVVKKDNEELDVQNGVDEEFTDEPAEALDVEKTRPKKKSGRAKSLESAKPTTAINASAHTGRKRNPSKN